MSTPTDRFADLYTFDATGRVQRWQSWLGLVLLPIVAMIAWPLALLPLFCVAVYIESRPTDVDQFIAELAAATDLANLTTLPPSLLLYTNLTLAALIPTVWLLHKYLHSQPLAGVVRVVARSDRTRLMGIGGAAAVAAVVIQMLLTVGYETVFEPQAASVTATQPSPYTTGMLVAFAFIVVFTTPLQSAAEELVFRGYLLRVLRAVTCRRTTADAGQVRPPRTYAGLTLGLWVPVLLTSLLFAAAHGAQSPAVFFDRFCFGLLAAWLTLRTGGLEVAIVWHIVNNVLVFAVAGALGATAQALAPAEIGLWHMPITLAGAATMLGCLHAAGLLRPRPDTHRSPNTDAPAPHLD